MKYEWFVIVIVILYFVVLFDVISIRELNQNDYSGTSEMYIQHSFVL